MPRWLIALAALGIWAVSAAPPPAAPVDWVPARWTSSDPGTLDLVQETPINCLLMEEAWWSQAFAEEAARRGVATLAVVHWGGEPLKTARRALELKFTGVALEGDWPAELAANVRKALEDSRVPVVDIAPRVRLRFDSRDRAAPLMATYQGVWPGIQVQKGGAVRSAPSGAPWIDTNTGFLRFARAAAPQGVPVWIANTPPEKTVVTGARYLQAIGDAAMNGARWVVALDGDFAARLYKAEPAALADWRRMGDHLRFFEQHREWRAWRERASLALVQDASSGALLSGGILDMIAVKHTPVRPVPVLRLSDEAMRGSTMAVSVDPQSLTGEQREVLRRFTRAGGTLLSGPPGWKMPAAREQEITLSKSDLDTLDQIWRETNQMTGRRNLGARLFNVASMLSNLLESPDGRTIVLHLVNFSDYPAESITIHLLGKYSSARLLTPGGAEKKLDTYEMEEGTGVDIERIGTLATLVLN
jgi:hypothetical protein